MHAVVEELLCGVFRRCVCHTTLLACSSRCFLNFAVSYFQVCSVCVCIMYKVWCVVNTCSLSCRSTISSGPSRRSRCTERSGTTWSSPSPRRSATSHTTSPSTPGSSRCQSSLFTYSVSSHWLGLSSQLCAACLTSPLRWCRVGSAAGNV